MRGDVAIKVFGDDFEALQQTANRIASTLKRVDGASEVKVEQVEGQALLDIAFNREQLARYGLPLSDVQDMVAAAIGGREAGQVFEGDRHFAIVVRFARGTACRHGGLRALPIPVMVTAIRRLSPWENWQRWKSKLA